MLVIKNIYDHHRYHLIMHKVAAISLFTVGSKPSIDKNETFFTTVILTNKGVGSKNSLC